MGIVLLTIGLLIVNIVPFIIGCIKNRCVIGGVSLYMCALAGGVLLGELLGMGILHCTFENKYNQKLYQKEMLEYRLEDNGLQGNEFLYHDITEFNNELRSVKYWYNNAWTNWFNNGKVASIDYIEIGA